MALVLALNIVPILEEEVAHDRVFFPAIKACASALKLAKGWRLDAYLLTSAPFASLQVSSQISLSSFLSHAEIREEVRVLMSMANRAPGFKADDGIEVRSQFGVCWAAQAAYELDGIIVSIAQSEEWKLSFLDVSVSQISEAGEVFDENLPLEHVFDSASCEEHRSVIESRGRGVPQGGVREMWARRAELFPSLTFLARVEGDIEAVATSGSGFLQIYNRLNSIEASSRAWRAGDVSYPVWNGKITNESDSRRALCDFTNEEGTSFNYQLHARYTPGAGRIHFRTVDETKGCEIAYIGWKIGG